MVSSKNKKILIIAESINAEDSSGSKANISLIQNLHKAGYEILIYHFTKQDIQLDNLKCVSIKEKRAGLLFWLSRLQRKLQHNFKINLAKHLEPIFGFSFTFFNDSESIVRTLKKEKDFNPDLVLTLSKGASFRPHYALVQLPEFHEKWMAYIHDPYPFHYYPSPYAWSEPGYKQKINFFKNVASKCKWVGYPSILLAEWMENHYEDFISKRIIIPHQLAQEIKAPVVLPEWFEQDKFNLLHAGNLMKQRDPFPLIKAFEKFLLNNPEARTEARMLLVGSATYHFPELIQKKRELEQLFISDGYLSYHVVQKLQEKTSVNIILESSAELSPFLPGKFPHCVAANKTIFHLGPQRSEVRRILGPTYEYWAEADNVEKICFKLQKLYKTWKKNPESLKLNREDVEEYLSAFHLEKQINNLI